MMRRYLYLVFVIATGLLAGCASEMDPFTAMEGTGHIALQLSADGKMPTRAEEEKPLTEDMKNQYMVSIYRGNTEVISSKVVSQLTEEDLTVQAGSGYRVTAENCSLADAESQPTLFGQPRLFGTSGSLTVTKEQTTTASVHCTPVNAGVKVVTDENFNEVFSDYEFTTTLGSRKLTFTPQNASITGYYNVPADGATLSYSLVANRKAGGDNATASSTAQLQVGKITQLKLTTTPKGYINLTITYDDHFLTENIDLIIDTENNDDNDDTEVIVDPSQETNRQLVKTRK